MKKRILSLVTLLSLTLSLTVSAQAAMIVDTGIPGTVYDMGLTGSNYGQTKYAGQFVLNQGTVITAVRGYVDTFGGRWSGIVDAAIYGNNTTGRWPLPDVATEFWRGQFSVTNTSYSWEGLSGLNWNLKAGTYWLAIEATTPGFYGKFARNASNYMPWYANFNNGSWNALDKANGLCFQIEGVAGGGSAPVPEPSTYLLFSLGLGGLALWKRRQQRRLM